MSVKLKHKAMQQWIPILMAFIAVASLVTTIYFSHKQQKSTQAILSVQLAMKFNDIFDSDSMTDSRRSFAKAIFEGKEPPDEDVLGFFDTYYENVEWLYQDLLQADASRRHSKITQEAPTKRELEDFLKDEASLPDRNSLQKIHHH